MKIGKPVTGITLPPASNRYDWKPILKALEKLASGEWLPVTIEDKKKRQALRLFARYHRIPVTGEHHTIYLGRA